MCTDEAEEWLKTDFQTGTEIASWVRREIKEEKIEIVRNEMEMKTEMTQIWNNIEIEDRESNGMAEWPAYDTYELLVSYILEIMWKIVINQFTNFSVNQILQF